MTRLVKIFAALAVLTALGLPASAQADFGLKGISAAFTDANGSPSLQAGSHPFAFTTTLATNTTGAPAVPDGEIKDLVVDAPVGLAGTPTPVPTCSSTDFFFSECSDASALGITEVTIQEPGETRVAPVYNLVPPPGVAAKFGFIVLGIPVTVEAEVNPAKPNNLIARSSNILSQVIPIYSVKLTLWGVPAAAAHDSERGNCALSSGGQCPAGIPPVPFLTLPRSCEGPLATTFKADSWENPGAFVGETVLTHSDSTPPQPIGTSGCNELVFAPTITAQPTTKAASSPTGLDFSLDVSDEGLTNPSGRAQSDIRKAVVTLPEGFTTNPALAEGLGVCTEGQLASETAGSAPGAGCPEASKIGTIEVESPLIKESLKGSLFIAKPFENEFHSLLAFYIVVKNPILGIVVTQAAKVGPDPNTGQLKTIVNEIPQIPFSHFKLHFREGARSPLASPPGCGTYNAVAELTPWSGDAPVTTSAAFQIITGAGGGACPSGGLPPFHPGLEAGTLNNSAGQYSPFNLRLSRNDSEQEITHFSIKLPPGVTGKLAGIPFCPDAAIAAAKLRSGTEEEANPSCPAASEVGHTLAGAGVGPILAYAPGKIYLAGPYHGSALSITAITAAKVGPFDLGTVVVRQALKINPETAEVFIDATGSDPLPHIIDGIPVHLRDIRAYIDRPEFVLNPTGCKRTSTASTVLGSGLDFASEADDQPVTVSTPFQAANCAVLGFMPKLDLSLKGGTKRGQHPALKAVLRPRAGDANATRVSVQLPHSEFLEQSHIRTICTRVQFAAGAGNGSQCPAGSIYGHAKAFTPILAQPLEGPIFLRSSSHPLPDLVLALHGLFDFDAVGRIDSVNGSIRNTFEFVPDAPITKVVVNLQGDKKGLLVNSTNLCREKHRAVAKLAAHNGRSIQLSPVLAAQCGTKGKS